MWIAAVIIGVIAAMVALIAIIGAVSNKLKSMDPGEQLKKAEEEANRMSEALQKAKDAADALRTSINKYDSAVDKMHSLTEGTDEYKAALNEANDEARKLIEENSELEGKYSFNVETGLIEFDEGALEEI
jgi:septal ring factor EnvC (AmiA/AmiB activator)